MSWDKFCCELFTWHHKEVYSCPVWREWLSFTWTGQGKTDNTECLHVLWIIVNIKINLNELHSKRSAVKQTSSMSCAWWCHSDDVIVSLSSCLSELRLEVFLLWPHFLLERAGCHSGLAGLYRPGHVVQSELTLLSYDKQVENQPNDEIKEQFSQLSAKIKQTGSRPLCLVSQLFPVL